MLIFCEGSLNPPTSSKPEWATLSLPPRPQALDLDLQQSDFIKKRKSLPDQKVYAGMPEALQNNRLSQHHIKVLQNKGYISGYDETLKLPAWSAYRLYRQTEVGFNIQSSELTTGFRIDLRTNSKVPSSLFNKSGYDRGHMAPGDAIEANYGLDAKKETFLMSNICPQIPGFNRGIWKAVETLENNHWANSFAELWIITGPVLEDNSKIIESRGTSVPVPSKFFKIFVDESEGKIRMLAVILPHQALSKTKLEQFIYSVREVEKATGLDFYSQLPDPLEDHLEQSKAKKLWPAQ